MSSVSFETTLLAGDAGSSMSTVGGRRFNRGPLPLPDAEGRGVMSISGERSGVIGGGLAILSCCGEHGKLFYCCDHFRNNIR